MGVARQLVCLIILFLSALNQLQTTRMKQFLRTQNSIWVIILLISGILLTPSCKKDDDPDPIANEVYNSHKLLISYSSSGIKTLFEIMSIYYPEVADLVPEVQYSVNVYKVTYYTNFEGSKILVSGLVCVPNIEGESFPIMSFQNGTNTSHSEAPTVNYNGDFFKYLESAASMGYIVLIPDYIGFGASEDIVHPYVHKSSTIQTVNNFIEAVSEMYDNKFLPAGWNKDVFLMGYSQGGWASLASHQYISSLTNSEINLRASSCGAGPYDLSIVQNFMFSEPTYPQPVYMAYTGVSYSSLGLIDDPLSDYFNEPFATNLPSYFDGSMSNGQINEKLNDTVAVLVTESFLTGFNDSPKFEDFRNAMDANSVYGWDVKQPVRLYHGTADIYVPPTTSETVYQEFIEAGASSNVTYIELEGKDHLTGAIPMVVGSLLWFEEIK